VKSRRRTSLLRPQCRSESLGAGEEAHKVDLAPIAEDVGVGVRRDAELLLPDQAPDLGPRLALTVEEADPGLLWASLVALASLID
jgi:hypothetical protein